MIPTSIQKHPLFANTTKMDRGWARTFGYWGYLWQQGMAFVRAYRRPLSVLIRVYRSGPWPYLATLRDGEIVTLVSRRGAWMYAHNSPSHRYSMARMERLREGTEIFEFAEATRAVRVVLAFAPGAGDPGVFLSNEYGELPVENRTVVDIGGGVGESAVYFALGGANRVLSFEPHPSAYDQALQNVSRNGLADRISVERSAVGPTPGDVSLEASTNSATWRALAGTGGTSPTRVTSLLEIVGRISAQDASLKIDCEGDEYGVILGAPAHVLRRFKDIVIEYHFGSRMLQKALKDAGFSVRARAPVHVPGSPSPGVYFGKLTAHRLGEGIAG